MRPIHDMLREASGRGRFHMPGHKGRAPFGPDDLYRLDTTELPVTDDLYAPERGIALAQRLYARAAGAAETLFLHNGSSCGIHIMMQLWAREGDTVLLPRNAHLSAVNGCVMGGARVRWIPVTQMADGYCFIREADVLEALDRHPEARTLLLTRPDYYGGCLPLARIIDRAHALGMRVAVDEAHGAHLPWMDAPLSAGALGADAWVQSVHKTLPGLTGSAALHLRDAADAEYALRLMRREQTSSPSFLLMMGIDDARAYMEERGAKELRRVIARAEELRRRLPALGYADAHGAWGDTGLDFDPTRLVIAAPQGGDALAKALRERGIDVEMNDLSRAVLILTAMDGDADFAALADALGEIVPALSPAMTLLPPCPLPERALEVRPAATAPCETVPLSRAEGRIAAASAGLYPPGVPLICPGERFDGNVLERLMHAGHQQRFGVEGDKVLCVTTSV
ncbi:MAG: aminotransferase class I/II-fold pyridoxal phosphate-dependent enzyme [Aristaeellaceae bacterium]